ncbi:hypothetical protein TNCV_3955791 [Trichonephila clavipes]|nr:hypothetical protein TNCV_3955791 [Trichonephila clavipes]
MYFWQSTLADVCRLRSGIILLVKASEGSVTNYTTTHPSGIVGSSQYSESEPKLLMTQTTVPKGLSLNPGKGIEVCKCLVPEQHGSPLHIHLAESPFKRLAEGKERGDEEVHPCFGIETL